MSGHLARDRGSATAELAIAMPAVMVVLATVLAAGQVMAVRLRCIDAARGAVRLAARGEPAEHSVAEGIRTAPPGSRVELGVDGRSVTVRVSARVRVAGYDVVVVADAAADREQP